MSRTRTICILYGVNEGPAIGRAFERACRQASLIVTRNAWTADILFTHSAGCFIIPDNAAAKRIVAVGVPYQSGRSLLAATYIKTMRDFRRYRRQGQTLRWLVKFAWHIRYFFNWYGDWNMWRGSRSSKPWNFGSKLVVIRNAHDVYCTLRIAEELPDPAIRFVSLPGEHDDCWYNPTPYVQLLQK